jgi:HlyD family secretion protein
MNGWTLPRWQAAALAAAAALALAAWLWPHATHADEQPAAKPRPALAVNVVRPERAPLALQLPANGSIAAWQEASVGTESNGLRLTEVRVNVGDMVKKGQLLATFADETVQADVAQARANLLEAQSSAAEAAANDERARTLQATGALSAQQIQQYATAGQTAKARVKAAQAQLRVQELRLAHTKVLAPDDGVISARTATVGAVTGAGAELFRMVRKGRLEWRAEVASGDLPRLRAGAQVRVTAASGAQVLGTVRMVAPTVDPQTRNALVYVDLPTHPDVRAGMFARGEFVLGERSALTVPLSAVVVRDGFSNVFEIAEGSRVRMQRVQTGQRAGDRVEVLSGLPANAAIVARGGAFLNDGDLVSVQADSASKQAPAPTPSAQAASK